MIRAALAACALWAVASCGRAQGVSDQELGGLVVDTKVADKAIAFDELMGSGS